MTKEKLRGYKKLEAELRTLERQMETLAASVYTVKAILIDGMPNGNGGKDFSDLLVKLEDMKECYARKWDELIDMRLRIEQAIEGLKPLYRTILREYYMHGKVWEKIAHELNYSTQHVHRIHGWALQELKHESK